MLKYLDRAFSTSFCLFFASLFVGPALFSFDFGGFSIFPARIMLAVVWFLFLAGIIAKEVSLSPWGEKYARRIIVFLASWLAFSLISLTWAASVRDGMRDILNMATGFSVVALALFLDKKYTPVLLKIWAVVFAASIVLGAIEHLTTLHLPISRFFSNQDLSYVNYRPTGFFDNENNYASFLTLSMPLALSSFRVAARIRKCFWGLSIFLGVYLTLVTTSRINFFGLCIVFMAFALVMTEKGTRLKTFAALLILILCTSMCMSILQPALQGVVADTLGSVYDAVDQFLGNLGTGIDDNPYPVRETSIAVRINMVRNGLLIIRDTWGRGVGAGNFENWIADRAYFDTESYVNPHNWWIELLAEYGLLVFAGYLALWGFLTWELVKKQFCSSRYAGVVALSLLILPVVALSPSSFLTYYPHWLMLALAVAVVVPNGEEEEKCES